MEGRVVLSGHDREPDLGTGLVVGRAELRLGDDLPEHRLIGLRRAALVRGPGQEAAVASDASSREVALATERTVAVDFVGRRVGTRVDERGRVEVVDRTRRVERVGVN